MLASGITVTKGGNATSANYNITDERAIQLNNAGVDVAAAGYPRVAWELFKGALEVKLAVERYVNATEDTASATVTDDVISTMDVEGDEEGDEEGIEEAMTDLPPIQTTDSSSHHSSQEEKYNIRLQQQEEHQQHHEQHPQQGQIKSSTTVGPPQLPYPSNVFIQQAERHMAMIDIYKQNPVPWYHRNGIGIHVDGSVSSTVRTNTSSNSNNSSSNNNIINISGIENGTMGTVDTVGPSPSADIEQTITSFPVNSTVATTTSTTNLTPLLLRAQYTPRLVARLIVLEEPPMDPNLRAERSGKESATIIYNLALVDHLTYECSEQAIALYQLALSLCIGIPDCDSLCISLLNNVAIWSYENGDIDNARAWMQNLASVLQQYCYQKHQQHLQREEWSRGYPDEEQGRQNARDNTFSSSFIAGFESKELKWIESNLLWFMDPYYAISPAA